MTTLPGSRRARWARKAPGRALSSKTADTIGRACCLSIRVASSRSWPVAATTPDTSWRDDRPGLRPGQLVGGDSRSADLHQQLTRPGPGDGDPLAGQAGRVRAGGIHGPHGAGRGGHGCLVRRVRCRVRPGHGHDGHDGWRYTQQPAPRDDRQAGRPRQPETGLFMPTIRTRITSWVPGRIGGNSPAVADTQGIRRRPRQPQALTLNQASELLAAAPRRRPRRRRSRRRPRPHPQPPRPLPAHSSGAPAGRRRQRALRAGGRLWRNPGRA
jgi:hypothetical protein